MGRKKIAPTLQRFFPAPDRWAPTGDFLRAKAELRALLAVARAAQYEGWGADHHEQRSGGTCRLCRALARLERAGKENP